MDIVNKFKVKHSYFSLKGSTMQTFLVTLKYYANFFMFVVPIWIYKTSTMQTLLAQK